MTLRQSSWQVDSGSAHFRAVSNQSVIVFLHEFGQGLIGTCSVSKPDFLVRIVVCVSRHAISVTDVFLFEKLLKKQAA